MNQIANFGSENGNFIFVDTNVADYEDAIEEALGDSFDIALGGNSAVKLRIENQAGDFKLVNPAEINYIEAVRDVSEEEEQKGAAQYVEDEFDVLVTVQQIQKTS